MPPLIVVEADLSNEANSEKTLSALLVQLRLVLITYGYCQVAVNKTGGRDGDSAIVITEEGHVKTLKSDRWELHSRAITDDTDKAALTCSNMKPVDSNSNDVKTKVRDTDVRSTSAVDMAANHTRDSASASENGQSAHHEALKDPLPKQSCTNVSETKPGKSARLDKSEYRCDSSTAQLVSIEDETSASIKGKRTTGTAAENETTKQGDQDSVVVSEKGETEVVNDPPTGQACNIAVETTPKGIERQERSEGDCKSSAEQSLPISCIEGDDCAFMEGNNNKEVAVENETPTTTDRDCLVVPEKGRMVQNEIVESSLREHSGNSCLKTKREGAARQDNIEDDSESSSTSTEQLVSMDEENASVASIKGENRRTTWTEIGNDADKGTRFPPPDNGTEEAEDDDIRGNCHHACSPLTAAVSLHCGAKRDSPAASRSPETTVNGGALSDQWLTQQSASSSKEDDDNNVDVGERHLGDGDNEPGNSTIKDKGMISRELEQPQPQRVDGIDFKFLSPGKDDLHEEITKQGDELVCQENITAVADASEEVNVGMKDNSPAAAPSPDLSEDKEKHGDDKKELRSTTIGVTLQHQMEGKESMHNSTRRRMLNKKEGSWNGEAYCSETSPATAKLKGNSIDDTQDNSAPSIKHQSLSDPSDDQGSSDSSTMDMKEFETMRNRVVGDSNGADGDKPAVIIITKESSIVDPVVKFSNSRQKKDEKRNYPSGQQRPPNGKTEPLKKKLPAAEVMAERPLNECSTAEGNTRQSLAGSASSGNPNLHEETETQYESFRDKPDNFDGGTTSIGSDKEFTNVATVEGDTRTGTTARLSLVVEMHNKREAAKLPQQGEKEVASLIEDSNCQPMKAADSMSQKPGEKLTSLVVLEKATPEDDTQCQRKSMVDEKDTAENATAKASFAVDKGSSGSSRGSTGETTSHHDSEVKKTLQQAQRNSRTGGIPTELHRNQSTLTNMESLESAINVAESDVVAPSVTVVKLPVCSGNGAIVQESVQTSATSSRRKKQRTAPTECEPKIPPNRGSDCGEPLTPPNRGTDDSKPLLPTNRDTDEAPLPAETLSPTKRTSSVAHNKRSDDEDRDSLGEKRAKSISIIEASEGCTSARQSTNNGTEIGSARKRKHGSDTEPDTDSPKTARTCATLETQAGKLRQAKTRFQRERRRPASAPTPGTPTSFEFPAVETESAVELDVDIFASKDIAVTAQRGASPVPTTNKEVIPREKKKGFGARTFRLRIKKGKSSSTGGLKPQRKPRRVAKNTKEKVALKDNLGQELPPSRQCASRNVDAAYETDKTPPTQKARTTQTISINKTNTAKGRERTTDDSNERLVSAASKMTRTKNVRSARSKRKRDSESGAEEDLRCHPDAAKKAKEETTKRRTRRKTTNCDFTQTHVEEVSSTTMATDPPVSGRRRSTATRRAAQSAKGTNLSKFEDANIGVETGTKCISSGKKITVKGGGSLKTGSSVTSKAGRSSGNGTRSATPTTRSVASSLTSSTPAQQRKSCIRIAATNVEINRSFHDKIKKIRGLFLDDLSQVHTATHVIVSDGKRRIRRTPKLLIGLCRSANIVSLNWLTQSAKQGKALEVSEEFLLLGDKAAEAQYDFSMRQTLGRIERNLRNGAFLLQGWNVHVCKGVAGDKAPPGKELRLIVEAAGGTWLSSMSALQKRHPQLLLITSDPELKQQLAPCAVASALRNGATKKTVSWLLHAIMTQRVDL